MCCKNIWAKKANLTQEFGVGLSIKRCRSLQLKSCLRQMSCNQGVLFIGKLAGHAITFFVDGPDHVRGNTHLYSSARFVVALHLLARISDGVFRFFDELARNAIFFAGGYEPAADKAAHPGLFISF